MKQETKVKKKMQTYWKGLNPMFWDYDLCCSNFLLKKSLLTQKELIFHRENQLHFEVTKGVKFEDKVECEGEKVTIKKVLEKEEANQRRIFTGIEKDTGKNENNVLITMSKDRTDRGCDQVKENYGEEFIFLKKRSIKVECQ